MPQNNGNSRSGAATLPMLDLVQFSLGSLLLVMLWLAIGLGMVRITPWVGVPYFVASLPAVFRTWHCTRRWRIEGQVLTNGTRIRVFLQSLELLGRLVALSSALALSVLGIAVAWTAVVATRFSRLAALTFGKLAVAVQWVQRHALPAMGRRPGRARAGVQRRGVLAAGWSAVLLGWGLVVLASRLILVALLVLLVTVAWLARHLADVRFACERYFRSLRHYAAALAAADGRLLRRFAASGP